MRTLLVTACTPGYRDLAGRLIGSCVAHGLDLHVKQYESTGDWVRNGHIKPTALLEAMALHPGRPVCWVDADAIVRQPPVLFDQLADAGIDVAYHTIPKTAEVLSGTVWCAHDVYGFLRQWAELLVRAPRTWDQKLLAHAAVETECVVERLPAEYCWIDTFSHPRWGGPRDPVIEHTQASRDVRAGKRAM